MIVVFLSYEHELKAGESMARVDSSVPLMYHDPDRSWITDPDPDHLKGTHPNRFFKFRFCALMLTSKRLCMRSVRSSTG